jgi:tight adherence protein B
MVTAALPFLIGLGVCAIVALCAHSAVGTLNARGTRFVKRFSTQLDVAGVRLEPEKLVVIASGGGIGLWVLIAILLRPALIVGALLLPACLLGASAGVYCYISMRSKRRREQFLTQLETAMRLLASGLRIGLSLRLAMNMLTEELDGPVRYEFARVIGQTNIGISPYDALDAMAERIPSSETLMLAKVVRIQAQTGGNLSAILEHLATTIKERRRIARKINALTAEGRIGALVLEALPLLVGAFILATQRDMAIPLLTTPLGHGVLFGVAGLEVCAIFTLNRMLQVRA